MYELNFKVYSTYIVSSLDDGCLVDLHVLSMRGDEFSRFQY